MVYAQLVSNMLALSQLENGVGLRATEFLLQTRFAWNKYAPPPEIKPPAKGKKVLEQEAADQISGGLERQDSAGRLTPAMRDAILATLRTKGQPGIKALYRALLQDHNARQDER
jgi:hypothetical protein